MITSQVISLYDGERTEAKADPDFQQEVLSHVVECSLVGRALGCPFYIENPIGAS